MARPAVTVVVTPREQFSKARMTLDSIFAHTAEPYDLIYIDGKSPEPLRGELRALALERGFDLIREERLLPANVARNLAAPRIRTKYAVFIDNDVEVTPGWLEPLVACAEATDAWVVGPLYCVRENRELIIHTIGAEHGVDEVAGVRRWRERHLFCGEKVSDVRGQLRRRPIDLVEFHCLLMRTDAIEKLGPFDPQLLSYFDHNDFCLQVRAAGGGIFHEPASTVIYHAPPPFEASDIPYFLLRWSNRWIRTSVTRFANKHGISPKDRVFDDHYEYQQAQRARLTRHPRQLLRRMIGKRGLNLVEDVIDALLRVTLAADPRAAEAGGRRPS
ncbi:MAG TPA: glycosyltransferase [Caulobacteraceae bacterium]|jgi:glycosyltransferase involved in cell wall biosynthesis|nr:glycosyltransferase [Caulobacteraceae bacterium]